MKNVNKPPADVAVSIVTLCIHHYKLILNYRYADYILYFLLIDLCLLAMIKITVFSVLEFLK